MPTVTMPRPRRDRYEHNYATRRRPEPIRPIKEIENEALYRRVEVHMINATPAPVRLPQTARRTGPGSTAVLALAVGLGLFLLTLT
jgi:hypothetical protein